MKTFLNALVLVAVACTSAAYGQGNERAVCGVPLKTQAELGKDNSLTWGVYSKSPLPGNRDAIYDSLGKLLDAHSMKWTADVRQAFSPTFQELAAGGFKPADFVLTTVAGDANSIRPRQVAFAHTAREFELPIEASAPACADAMGRTSRIEAGNFVLLVQRALAELNLDGFKAMAARIKKLEEQYDRVLFDGFPMFPWEAWANSRFLTDRSIANGPPRNVLVLGHPSAGMVGSIDTDTSSDAGGVLAVEPIGLVRYSRNYHHWYGASLLAVFPTDRNAGYGVAFNYDNFKLGVTWHDDKGGEHDGLALFLGMDLYQLVSDKKKSYEDYIDALKGVSVEAATK